MQDRCEIDQYVRSIPDFPEPGIIFRDITSVIQSPEGLKKSIDGMIESLKDVDFNVVLGSESRGFIFGMPVAYALNKGFVPVRKKGKLPCETIEKEYALEYGTAVVEIHKDAIKPGDKVVIIDDLIATGGTIEAIIEMVESLGGEVVKIQLVKSIDEIRFNKSIWGIEEVRDESDRKGLRIVIDISEEANAELILNYLYKNTDLQVSYNFNVVTIDNRTPRLTGIQDILDSYIEHQKDVLLRRSRYD